MKAKGSNFNSQRGFSLVELLIVIMIIGIMGAIIGLSFRAPKLYNAENQALRLIDLIREAQQSSLTQKNTMRVEINATRRVIRLINENTATTAGDDVLVKSFPYTPLNASTGDNSVFFGVTPTNMTTTPVEVVPIDPIAFANSTHPLSLGEQVATLRFRKDSAVLSAGSNAIGTGAIPTGATIYVWTRRASEINNVAEVLRAVTVSGSSGSTKLWKCGVINNQCTTWTK